MLVPLWPAGDLRYGVIRELTQGMRVEGPGAVAANLYQGIRSEYLAQYVFSMFGTVTRVPNEEDHGVDLVCTLTRRAGGRAEPFAYYSVQVKSAPGDWVFGGPGSVRWILEYPAPLLFCATEKKAARFTMYQLTARFQAALMPERPDSLTLVPAEAGQTDPVHRPRVGWDADGRLHLGPPILQFTVDELLDDQKFGLFSSILEYWIPNDLRNILRQQMGMRSASGPAYYATNEVPPPSGFGTFSMAVVLPEIRERASRTAAEHLDWLGDVMRQSGDATGALLAALMVRHLVPGEDPGRQLESGCGLVPVFPGRARAEDRLLLGPYSGQPPMPLRAAPSRRENSRPYRP